MMATKKVADAMPASVREYLSKIGTKGGSVEGKVKKRGSKQYYRELQLKAAAARKANREAAEEAGE